MATAKRPAYEQVERLISSTVKSFRRGYGGEWQELLSEAGEHYVDADNSYESDRARYSTWVRFKVWHGLLETHRTKCRRQGILPQDFSLNLNSVHERERFDLDKFLAELSGDAATMISLVLESPKRYPRHKRMAVVEALLGMGWGAERIVKTFLEIREAL